MWPMIKRKFWYNRILYITGLKIVFTIRKVIIFDSEMITRKKGIKRDEVLQKTINSHQSKLVLVISQFVLERLALPLLLLHCQKDQ